MVTCTCRLSLVPRPSRGGGERRPDIHCMRMRYVFHILYCKTCPQKFRSSGIHAKRGFTEQVSGQPRVQRPTQTSGNMTILEAADLLHHQGHKGKNNENGARERTGMLKLVVKQKRQELVADRLAIARSKTSLP